MEEVHSFSVDNLVGASSSTRRTSSIVWRTFEKIMEDGKQKYKCKRCENFYAGGGGTSNLKRHMNEMSPFREVRQYGDQVEEFDQSIFREKLVIATILHNYPYRFVEHEGIKAVFSYLNPAVVNVSRNTSRADVAKIYHSRKKKVKAQLEAVKSRICLTSDLWSSQVTTGYMTVTAHYVDNNWVLKKKVLIQEEMANEDTDISSMATRMKPKFDKYWKDYSAVLIFAIVLDPRYKFTFVEFCYKKVDSTTAVQKVRELREQMRILFEDYLHSFTSRADQSSVASLTTHDGDEDIVMKEFDVYRDSSANVRSQSQLEAYLAEPPIDKKQFPDLNILDYWRGNCTKYPQLALMARDILSIPITSVASESAFSHAGRIIDKFHTAILPTNAEARLCGRDWFEACDSEDDEEDLSTDIGKLIEEMSNSSFRIER